MTHQNILKYLHNFSLSSFSTATIPVDPTDEFKWTTSSSIFFGGAIPDQITRIRWPCSTSSISAILTHSFSVLFVYHLHEHTNLLHTNPAYLNPRPIGPTIEKLSWEQGSFGLGHFVPHRHRCFGKTNMADVEGKLCNEVNVAESKRAGKRKAKQATKKQRKVCFT